MGTENGWVHCHQEHLHWGRFGAAGLLVSAPSDTEPGAVLVLLQRRARWTHHGGSWALPGGARRRGEDPRTAALRECGEEVRGELAGLRVTGELADEHGGWSYTTVLAQLPRALALTPRGWESTALRWTAAPHVADMALHPGFAALWPSLAVRLTG